MRLTAERHAALQHISLRRPISGLRSEEIDPQRPPGMVAQTWRTMEVHHGQMCAAGWRYLWWRRQAWWRSVRMRQQAREGGWRRGGRETLRCKTLGRMERVREGGWRRGRSV